MCPFFYYGCIWCVRINTSTLDDEHHLVLGGAAQPFCIMYFFSAGKTFRYFTSHRSFEFFYLLFLLLCATFGEPKKNILKVLYLRVCERAFMYVFELVQWCKEFKRNMVACCDLYFDNVCFIPNFSSQMVQ